MSNLIYPGDPEFDEWLSIPPQSWREVADRNSGNFCFVARSGSGILEAVSGAEATEYLYGGEYDERLEDMGEDDGSFAG